jgi:uroporphyrin-III C-methyltransferase
MNADTVTGKVYLVGAGPGDAELITVKGLRLIQSADVIIYDRLIPSGLLTEAYEGAELIDAGKAPAKHRLSQEAINDMIVQKALRGSMVVRLKGGDPFVFGRGGEEALACLKAGVPFEVVPGVSSAIAVPAYAGIPVTHRHVSTMVTIFAGHEDPTSKEAKANYEALASLGGTLVILMGVERLQGILDGLIWAGLSEETPAAVVEWGTTTDQRVIEGTVGTLADLAAEQNIQPPAVTIIGDVVRLRSQGVKWFEELFNEREPLRVGSAIR